MTQPRLALATTLLLLGCGSGTSVLLVVDVSSVAGAEQVQVVGYSGGDLAFGPAVRPERAGAPLEGPQTLRVLLPDALDGDRVEVSVFALVDGIPHGAGRATFDARRGREVRVEVEVTPIPLDCIGCDGCCDGERCLDPSVSACGGGGATCFSCDPTNADRCTGEGRCACGQGPSCDRVLGADRCQSGRCRCGDGVDPCAPGLQCDNGVCRCTPQSCAGCCLGNACQPGTLVSACGVGGAQCATCATTLTCSGGACVPG